MNEKSVRTVTLKLRSVGVKCFKVEQFFYFKFSLIQLHQLSYIFVCHILELPESFMQGDRSSDTSPISNLIFLFMGHCMHTLFLLPFSSHNNQ